jgi:hypothetical protein
MKQYELEFPTLFGWIKLIIGLLLAGLVYIVCIAGLLTAIKIFIQVYNNI